MSTDWLPVGPIFIRTYIHPTIDAPRVSLKIRVTTNDAFVSAGVYAR